MVEQKTTNTNDVNVYYNFLQKFENDVKQIKEEALKYKVKETEVSLDNGTCRVCKNKDVASTDVYCCGCGQKIKKKEESKR